MVESDRCGGSELSSMAGRRVLPSAVATGREPAATGGSFSVGVMLCRHDVSMLMGKMGADGR
jgi:hypothetical protein